MAESNLLQIAQEFCKRKLLPIPATVSGAQDDTTLQIWGLLNEGIQDIADRYNFQALQQRATFIHANGANYLAYDLKLVANTPGWKFMIQDTMWNQTARLPMGNPKSMREWQTIVIMLTNSTLYQWAMYGGAIYIFPVPTVPATTTFSFFYQSRYGVTDLGVLVEAYLSDASMPLLPTYLILADLKWRWAAAKGLPYAEDQRISESMLINLVGREPAPEIILDSDSYGDLAGPAPGLLIPAGNWNV